MSKIQDPQSNGVPGPPANSKFESLTAQLKYQDAEKQKEKGLLSNGSPRNPEKEKGSVQFAGGTQQLADKAFEQLKTQAQILLKQTQERPDPTSKQKTTLKIGSTAAGRKSSKDKSLQRNQQEETYPHEFKKLDDNSQPSDWYECFTTIIEKKQKIDDENNKVQNDIKRRQDRFIQREQDNRRKIDELQEDLKIRMVKKQIIGIADETDEYEQKIPGQQRHIKEDQIDHNNGQMNTVIDQIIPKLKKLKDSQEKDIIRKFNTEMKKMRDALEEQKSFLGDREGDLKERENEMQHNLELITSIAQRIDNENRLLIKKNAELQADFKAQENDRQLLVRQLVMQKKENNKISDEIKQNKRIINEHEKDEEQIDIQTFIQDMDNVGVEAQRASKTHMQGAQNEKQKVYSQMGLPPSGQNIHDPLVYQAQKKTESDEQKILRYERVIDQLKKMVDNVRRSNQTTRVQLDREVSGKTELEYYLKKAVDKVYKEKKKQQKSLNEINRNKRQGHKFYITSLNHIDSTPNITSADVENGQGDLLLNQEERERVIEILLGQEKVIALLYDRPPPDAQSQMNLKQHHDNAVLSSYNQHPGAMTADQTSYNHLNQNDIVNSEWMGHGQQYQYDPSNHQNMEEDMYGQEMDDVEIDQIEADEAEEDYLQAANQNIQMYRQMEQIDQMQMDPRQEMVSTQNIIQNSNPTYTQNETQEMIDLQDQRMVSTDPRLDENKPLNTTGDHNLTPHEQIQETNDQ